MPEQEYATLPRSPMNTLCDVTKDIARQLDGLIRLLVKEQGYAKIGFDVIKGRLGILRIERSFRMINE